MPTLITQIQRPKSETSALKGIGENCNQLDNSHRETVTTDTGIEPTVFKVEGTLYLGPHDLD
jgi:hypothetical protein